MNAPPAPLPPPADLWTAWPRSAQLATAFLLGMTLALLGTYLRGGDGSARPTEREQDLARTYRLDLNRAERADLLQLPGVGPNLAGRIADHRRQHGPFHRVDDRVAVHGVGPALLERVRPYVTVDADEADLEQRAPPARPRAPKSAQGSPVSRSAGKKESTLAAPIDVNRATLAELQRLPGIGPKLSQRIVDERGKGPFRTVDDLRRVAGIGAKTLERLRPHIRVGSEREQVAATE